MRYEELSLPIEENVLSIQFHPRLTVLTGLSGSARNSVIDAIASATTGATPGATVSLIDDSGRRHVIGDGALDHESTHAFPGPARRLRNLLEVSAEDLGLPRPSDDPGQLALQRELVATRDKLERVSQQLTKSTQNRNRHARLRAELEQVEATLAKLGSEADRYVHNRAKVLVELEGVRASLAAVDATPNRIARDAALIESTFEVQQLADQWATTSEKLDHLRAKSTHTERVESDQLSGLVDIPEAVPATLANAVGEHDRLVTHCGELQEDLEKALLEPAIAIPSDSRVLVLATLDQETLWLTHRDVVLATDALQAAQKEAQDLALQDPAERARIEQAHDEFVAMFTRAERRWLPGIIIATICACSAGALAITGLFTLGIPILLVLTLASLAVFVAQPRLAELRARRAEAAALASVGASNLKEYLHRFSDNPESERWRRADQVIEDYHTSMGEWASLVGRITPDDAGALEAQVHDWIEVNDPAHRDAGSTAVRRRLERSKTELAQATARLNTMLEPYGVTAGREPIGTIFAERVRLGRGARLQIELDEATETEGKLTRLLGAHLEQLGFESGNLATRISAYGRELDAALQRTKLRDAADDRDEVQRRIGRLETELSVPAPRHAHTDVESTEAEERHVSDLRGRRDQLKQQLADAGAGDDRDLTRRRDKLVNQVQGFEASLASDTDLPVEHPVDHLVKTLISHRPTWPTTDHEHAPAILDDPFAALATPLQRRLLNALDEVANMTQIILLTDDASVAEWAGAGARRGTLTLVGPRMATS